MSYLDNIATEEKINLHHNKQILSYLSLLEKFYEQSQEKSHQERLFRINKAINSIKKYSNCKVSSFNFKPSKTPTDKENNLDSKLTENTKDNLSISEVDSQKQNNIDDILHFIEKELKENGINENDINNSFLSTSKKSFNSTDNLEIPEKNSSLKEINSEAENIQKKNLNQRRLSKLFIKIELKLKTFLQENNVKKDLITDGKENNEDENPQKKEKDENIFTYSLGGKLTRSPSKLPNVIDSFFSDKNKVNSILLKVKKQRRKSVMDFNMKFCQLSKETKEVQYVNDSDDKGQKTKKRKKIIPCSAKIVIRNKVTKNHTSEKVSNFCDMIDEKEEDKCDIENINPFDKIIKEEEEYEKINKNDDNNIISEKQNIINIAHDSSIKISSSLNNKNKFHFNNGEINNNDNVNCIIITDNEKKVDGEKCENNFYVSKTSIFNNENENEGSNSINNNDNSLLDDEILMKSSVKKKMNDSQNEEDSKESGDSCSDKSQNNSNNTDEKYNILKYINDSRNRSNGDETEEEYEKSVSNYGTKSSNVQQQKNSFQREITRASNINAFCMNSILSPLKDFDIDDKIIKEQNNAIEDFTKFNP